MRVRTPENGRGSIPRTRGGTAVLIAAVLAATLLTAGANAAREPQTILHSDVAGAIQDEFLFALDAGLNGAEVTEE